MGSTLENMFLHYELLEDMDDYHKKEAEKMEVKSVRLAPSTVKMLDILVADIGKFENVTRAGLMAEFIENCGKELMAKRGLWTDKNQLSIFAIEKEKVA